MCLVVHSRFERALQTVDPSVTLPYFDSNLDHHLGDDLAAQTVTWTADFAGNGDGRVRTGPFADWSLPFPVNNRRFLYRNLTFAPEARTAPALMSDQALNTILNARQLRDICWNVDSSFETFHGATHNWVGGVMVNLPASPSDPIFFLHHSFIDCLFTWMRDNQRSRGFDVDFDYPNDTIAIGVGLRRQGDGRRVQRPEDSWHYSLAEMRPFGPLRNIDGLSSFYEDAIQCKSQTISSAMNPVTDVHRSCDLVLHVKDSPDMQHVPVVNAVMEFAKNHVNLASNKTGNLFDQTKFQTETKFLTNRMKRGQTIGLKLIENRLW